MIKSWIYTSVQCVWVSQCVCVCVCVYAQVRMHVRIPACHNNCALLDTFKVTYFRHHFSDTAVTRLHCYSTQSPTINKKYKIIQKCQYYAKLWLMLHPEKWEAAGVLFSCIHLWLRRQQLGHWCVYRERAFKQQWWGACTKVGSDTAHQTGQGENSLQTPGNYVQRWNLMFFTKQISTHFSDLDLNSRSELVGALSPASHLGLY